MWFRMQKQVIEVSDSDSTHEGDVSPDESPIDQGMTVVTSIPVEPGDFQRVRLLHQYEQSDAQEIDTERPLPDDERLRNGRPVSIEEKQWEPQHLYTVTMSNPDQPGGSGNQYQNILINEGAKAHLGDIYQF